MQLAFQDITNKIEPYNHILFHPKTKKNEGFMP